MGLIDMKERTRQQAQARGFRFEVMSSYLAFPSSSNLVLLRNPNPEVGESKLTQLRVVMLVTIRRALRNLVTAELP
jgi:hypothetical protein